MSKRLDAYLLVTKGPFPEDSEITVLVALTEKQTFPVMQGLKERVDAGVLALGKLYRAEPKVGVNAVMAYLNRFAPLKGEK